MMDWQTLLSNQRIGRSKPDIDQARSDFERDYDRIIFSFPFRRLQDKTQVFPLPEHDFVHTRLTHSLEVSVVGRSLGRQVGEVILQRHPKLGQYYSKFDFGAITAAAALAHDLGNPPFGHAGETAISEFYLSNPNGQRFEQMLTPQQWADFIDFEGNANGFRILNHPRYQDLRLTYATLAAFTKYPRPARVPEKEAGRRSQKKYGFFQANLQEFEQVATGTGMLPGRHPHVWRRHPLAFLVEAADDLCYHIIDLEDGCRMGLVSEEQTRDLLAAIIGPRYRPEKYAQIKSVDERIGALRALAIGELIQQCATVFLDVEAQILDGSFDSALADHVPAKKVMDEIIGLSIKNIYRSRPIRETEAAGYEVLDGLLEAFTTGAHAYTQAQQNGTKLQGRALSLYRLLPGSLRQELKNGTVDTYHMLLQCTEYVGNMTDSYAISLFRKIKGISLGA